MLKVYHAPKTRGFRVIWLCEELGMPYQIVPVDMSPAYRKSEAFRKLNPVGKVPVLTDGELTMFESGAMVQYILARYGQGKLQPTPGSTEYALYLQWSWFAEATFSRPLGEIVNHKREFASNPQQAIIDEMKSRARLCAQSLDAALTGKTWLLGDMFTAADVMMGLTLRSYTRHMEEDYPGNVKGYFNRLVERPAYQRADAADQNTGK